MRWIESLMVALSTYSALPMPQFQWNRRNMEYAICFFPAVGVLLGGALFGWYRISLLLDIGGVLFAAFGAGLPILLTGGIHMDGFMDTVDALSSHQSRERKLEILKDPHCGAFAVIYCGVYLLFSFALFYELYAAGQIVVCCPAFVLSRSLSALCALTMPNARKSGMLCAFTKDAQTKGAAIAMTLLSAFAASGMLLLSFVPGVCGVLLVLAVTFFYRAMAKKQFGGATGDTAGFFLQICELSALAGVWIGGQIL